MAQDPSDWDLVTSSRANTLVQGPEAQTDSLVTALTPYCPPPVVTVETPTSDALLMIEDGSVILENVARYTVDQQRELLSWLESAGSAVRLISTSSERLFDLVESGRFIEALYYRLNVILIDFTSHFFLAIVASLFGG
jgi:Sigma-54 interaction domain